MAAPYFCILPSDWPKWIYSSIQVQLYALVASFEKEFQANDILVAFKGNL